MSDSVFDIVRAHDADPAAAWQRLLSRTPSENLHDLHKAARAFRPDAALLTAINTALAVEAPLLLTGEPGMAEPRWPIICRQYFGMPLFAYQVRSTSTVEDMKYDFDAVGYLCTTLNMGPKMVNSKPARIF